jgi:hypothetical protein
MANTTQEVIIEINVERSQEKLAELNRSIAGLADAKSKFDERSKQGDIEATKELEKLNSTIRNTQLEYRAQQRVLDGYSKAVQAGFDKNNLYKNSIVANEAALKTLTAQYKASNNVTPAMAKQVNDIAEALNRQKLAIGDSTSNIGKYFDEFKSGVPVLGEVVSGVQNMGLAFQTAGGGVKGFASALAVTGLPLIISGITALVDIFSKYEPVAEAVERTTAGIGAAFSALVRGNDIIEAGRQTAELTGKLQELEDQQSLFDLNRARTRKEVIALLLESKNAGKTLGEQLQATIKANKLEKEENERQLENLRKQADLEEEIFAVKVGIRETYTKQAGDNLLRQLIDTDDYRNENLKRQLGITSDEVNVLRKRRQDIIEIEGESQNLQDRLANRTAAIIDKINDKREKEIELIKKLNEEKKKSRKDEEALNLKNEQNIIVEQSRLSQLNIDAAKKEADEIIKIKEDAYKKQLQLQNETSAEFLKNEEQTLQQKKTIQQAEVSFAKTVSSSLISFISNVAEASGASAAFNKTLALVEIATQTAIALVTGIASSQDLPYPGNLIAMGTTIASVLASIGQAVNIINSSPNPAKPSFALGGKVVDIDGKPHSQGGTPIHVNGQYVAEAEEGEGLFIMKRNAYQDIDRLSSWNQKHGGASWGMPTRFAALGGTIPVSISDGGFVARDISRSANNAITAGAMEQILKRLPAPQLSIVELETKQSSRNRSIKVSES